jgi:hypothetical protein
MSDLKEVSAFREELSEHVDVPSHSMPPNILILRRQTVRQFPNNTMVALYYNDKLKQYFSIPYGGGIDSVVTPVAVKEETSQEAEVKRHEKEATKWDKRKKRWDAWKAQQKPASVKEEAAAPMGMPDYVAPMEIDKDKAPMGIDKFKAPMGIDKNTAPMGTPTRPKWHYGKQPQILDVQNLDEGAISHLEKVKAFGADKPLYHKDGTQTKVDPQTAHALLTVHGALHPDNQKKMADAMEHSKVKFHKIVDFAWRQVK